MADVVAKNTVVRNSTYLTLAYIVQKALSFVYFVFYSRAIGYEQTGIYVLAISFATVFGILVDLGINPVLIREIARSKENVKRSLTAILGLKLCLGLLVYGLVVAAAHVMNYPEITQRVIMVTGLVMVLESLTLTLYSALRGYENFRYEAVGTIIYQVVLLSIGVAGIVWRPGLGSLTIALVGGASANLIYAVISVARKLEFIPWPKINWLVTKYFVNTAVPFFIAGVFTKVYAYIDIVILSKLTTAGHVGWYSVAYKLTYAIQFLPIALSNSVYPAFSKYFVDSDERLKRVLEQSIFFLISLSIPLALIIFTFADPIITNPHLWPTYRESVPALRISILSLPFIFINLIASSLLNAANKQKMNTVNIGITMASNIALNIILVPKWSHVGASMAALISSIVLFGLNFYWIRKIAPIRLGWILLKVVKSGLAAGLAVTAMSLGQSLMSIFALIPAGAMVYAIIYFMVGGYHKDDIRGIVSVITRRKASGQA